MSQSDAELLASLMSAGKYREIEPVAGRLLKANPSDVVALEALVEVLRRQKRWAELKATLQALSQIAPRSPQLHFSTGVLCTEFNEHGKALDMLRKTIELDPSHPTAPLELARVLVYMNRHEEAIDYLTGLIGRLAKPQEAYFRRAIICRRMGRLEEALADAQKALENDPNRVVVLSTLGDVLVDLGRFKEADEVLSRAARLDPVAVAASRARLYLTQGDLPTGFKEYDIAIRAQPKFFRSDVPGTAWTGQNLKGKTLLVYEEQGFGDTIQFIRYAEMLAGRECNVFVEIRSPLKQLVSRVKGVSWTCLRGAERPKYDYHVSVIQLPRLMNTKLSNIPAKIPYMLPPARLVEVWKEKVAGDTSKLKVGVCWFGNNLHDEDRRRSIPTNMLLPLKDVPDVSFYSLQRQTPEADSAMLSGSLKWIDHTAKLNDFGDTAALIANLDLVICVDTAIAHLAGAMGKPVWTLLSRGGEWRWLHEREDSPWYPTMRLMRQKDTLGWGPVVARVCAELNAKVRAEK